MLCNEYRLGAINYLGNFAFDDVDDYFPHNFLVKVFLFSSTGIFLLFPCITTTSVAAVAAVVTFNASNGVNHQPTTEESPSCAYPTRSHLIYKIWNNKALNKLSGYWIFSFFLLFFLLVLGGKSREASTWCSKVIFSAVFPNHNQP